MKGPATASRGRWYSAGVLREVWARLTSPFPPEALAWNVVELQADGVRARLEPAWSPDFVRARLDEQVGLDGWSYSMTAAGASGVVCNLTVQGVTRSAAAGAAASGASLEALAELAFSRCARQFGIAPAVAVADDSYWVDFDPEAGEPLYFPEPVPVDEGSPAALAPAPAQASVQGAAEPARQDASNEALAMIERLVDRLKAEGLGKEAAQLVARHHGRTQEEARELYSRLRALLIKKDAEE